MENFDPKGTNSMEIFLVEKAAKIFVPEKMRKLQINFYKI